MFRRIYSHDPALLNPRHFTLNGKIEMDLLEESVVRYIIRKGYFHKGVSDYYKNLYPDRTGFSKRNICRSCKTREITRISDNEVLLLFLAMGIDD